MAEQTEDKPRIYETKEELVRTIKEKDEIIADLQSQLETRNATLRGSSEPGWLILTKNQEYTGNVMGVHFDNGRGFLAKGKKDSEKTLMRMVSDFGYDVKEITAKEFEESRNTNKPADTTVFEKITQPNIIH